LKLKQRINLIFILVLAAVLAIVGFSFLAIYHLFSDIESDYNFVIQRLNVNIYALMIVSALTAISGVLIFRSLTGRILMLIEEINSFTQNMLKGQQDVKLSIKGPGELSILTANLNRMAELYRERITMLEKSMDKRQKAVRELQILNELTGFVISEMDFDVIVRNFAIRTSDLIKSEYCAVVIFEHDSYKPKLYVTREGKGDLSNLRVDPEGMFKQLFHDLVPIRLSSSPHITANDSREIEVPDLGIKVKDMVAIPLIFGGRLNGFLVLANKHYGSYDQDDEDALMSFTFQAFQTIAMHDEITNLAVTDGLTGLNNHRNFQDYLSKAVEHTKRYQTNLSLIILDVDHFKTFNDIYGHQVGDVVLKTIASIMSEEVRKTDFVARYGGEEFAVVMPETDYEGARILAERLRSKIANTPFKIPDGDSAMITVSIGFASIPENTREKEQLIEMADRALYLAKERGRNLTVGISDDINKKETEREGLKVNANRTFENLANLVDSKASFMKGHSQEVSRLSVMLAQEIGLKKDEIESLRIASILHDVGMVNIPERVINKPGELTEEEKKIIKAHPTLAEMMLKSHPKVSNVLPIILYHHERYDGKGYPAGISGEEIPVTARILAISEAFHAMISPRPYKKKLSIEEACRELQDKAGTQFDPRLVDAFIQTVKRQIIDNSR
jgi:diguanylate cyclase (GGDEF)-like protein